MSTLKTNNIQHVDRSDPSIIINTDGSVSIAGTLTYEDVTSVDSVGIVTARGLNIFGNVTGLNVASGISTFQAVTGTTGTFTGNVTISNSAPALVLTDTDNDSDFNIQANGGQLAFNDSTNSATRLSINSSGKVNINDTADSNTTLLVKSFNNAHPAIKLNASSSNGFVFLGDEYQTDESQFTMGCMYSSSALLLGWGIKPSTSADNAYISSQDSYATKHSGIRLDAEGIKFVSNDTSQTVTTDAAVTLTEKLRVTPGGRLGIGSESPLGVLQVDSTKSNGDTAVFRSINSSNPCTVRIDSPLDNNLRPASIALSNYGTDKWGIGQVYQATSSQSFHISSGAHSEANSVFSITTAGRVGIGTYNAATALDVRGVAASDAADIIVGEPQNAGKIAFRRGVDGSDASSIGYASATHNSELAIKNAAGDGYITFYTGANTERIRITPGGNFNITGVTTTTGGKFNDGSLGLRNKIINGDMRVSQRHGTTSTTPSNQNPNYIVDRWAHWSNQTSKMRYFQSSDAPQAFGFTKSTVAEVVSTHTTQSGDWLGFIQWIEAQDVQDLGLGTVDASPFTVSFLVKASIAGDYGFSIRNTVSSASYCFATKYTINAVNTWEKKIITVPAATSGSWSGGTGTGPGIWFDLGTGSSYHGTDGTWEAANDCTVSGTVSLWATNGATWRITGVQLEKGSYATDFEFSHIGDQLRRCKRYYQKVGYGNDLIIVNAINNNGARIPIPQLQETMRAQPTYTTNSQLTAFSSGTNFTVNALYQPGENGGGYIQLASAPTNGVYLKVKADAEIY